MINDGLLKIILKSQAEIWLRENPLCLNSQEKQKFLLDLNEYIEKSNGVLADEVFDFLVQRNLIENEPREETFINYLLKKYKNLKGVNVLDVGAGRICSLSKLIVEQGGKATAMDTNIRLSDGTIKKIEHCCYQKTL